MNLNEEVLCDKDLIRMRRSRGWADFSWEEYTEGLLYDMLTKCFTEPWSEEHELCPIAVDAVDSNTFFSKAIKNDTLWNAVVQYYEQFRDWERMPFPIPMEGEIWHYVVRLLRGYTSQSESDDLYLKLQKPYNNDPNTAEKDYFVDDFTNSSDAADNDGILQETDAESVQDTASSDFDGRLLEEDAFADGEYNGFGDEEDDAFADDEEDDEEEDGLGWTYLPTFIDDLFYELESNLHDIATGAFCNIVNNEKISDLLRELSHLWQENGFGSERDEPLWDILLEAVDSSIRDQFDPEKEKKTIEYLEENVKFWKRMLIATNERKEESPEE